MSISGTGPDQGKPPAIPPHVPSPAEEPEWVDPNEIMRGAIQLGRDMAYKLETTPDLKAELPPEPSYEGLDPSFTADYQALYGKIKDAVENHNKALELIEIRDKVREMRNLSTENDDSDFASVGGSLNLQIKGFKDKEIEQIGEMRLKADQIDERVNPGWS